LQGNQIAEKLDSLIVLTFLHLESCQSSGRLAEVFPTTHSCVQHHTQRILYNLQTVHGMFY